MSPSRHTSRARRGYRLRASVPAQALEEARDGVNVAGYPESSSAAYDGIEFFCPPHSQIVATTKSVSAIAAPFFAFVVRVTKIE